MKLTFYNIICLIQATPAWSLTLTQTDFRTIQYFFLKYSWQWWQFYVDM